MKNITFAMLIFLLLGILILCPNKTSTRSLWKKYSKIKCGEENNYAEISFLLLEKVHLTPTFEGMLRLESLLTEVPNCLHSTAAEYHDYVGNLKSVQINDAQRLAIFSHVILSYVEPMKKYVQIVKENNTKHEFDFSNKSSPLQRQLANTLRNIQYDYAGMVERRKKILSFCGFKDPKIVQYKPEVNLKPQEDCLQKTKHYTLIFLKRMVQDLKDIYDVFIQYLKTREFK